jgi:hypothetical protein
MTEVNKELAEAVWKAHDDGKSGPQITTLIGLPPTSVSRLIRSRKLFEKGRIDGEIALKIGWSVKRMAQVRYWWTAYHASRSQEPPQERKGSLRD